MITIIASVFNAEIYLANFLNYINSQLLKEFEVIFIDANSEDNSLEIIRNFNFRNGIGIKIIEQHKRINVYEAWNIGVLNSSNAWVMNFNTDDKLFPSALSIYAEYILKDQDFDIIYSNCFISSDESHKSLLDIKIWEDANLIENLMRSSCVGPFPIMKKSSVIEAGLFNEEFSIAGDYEMWSRMQRLGFKFLKIEEFIGVYFLNPVGISTYQTHENLKEIFRQNKLIKNSLQDKRNFIKKFLTAIVRIIRFASNEFKFL